MNGLLARWPIGAATVALCALFGITQSAFAAATQDDFTLTLTAYAWLPGLSGTVGARGHDTDFSASFSDIWDASDGLIGFYGRLEAHKGKFGLFADGGYGVIRFDAATDLGSGTIYSGTGLVDFGLMYR